ncbi:galactose-1-phosphate uridylyltransferase protein [Rutstroemia sp. NJR-2017a BVV2]|nr:galactose-1-phosphate uridylyltransferase protein [Rutstroemia sp. NJR-2017a BVV2]
MSQPMLNIGVWGWGPRDYGMFVTKNRALENNLRELGGRNWLCAHTFYTEEEFWGEYDGPWYQTLREKYFATSLPTVYEKVKIKPQAERKSTKHWGESWLSTWPMAAYMAWF